MMRRLLTGILCAALIGVVGCGGRGDDPNGAREPETFDEAFRARLGPNGEISKELALAGFETLLGQVPGIDIEPLPARGATGATVVVGAVREHWDELTQEQRAAVDRQLLGDEPPILLYDPASPNTHSSGGPALGKSAAQGRGADPTETCEISRSGTCPDTPRWFRDFVRQRIRTIEGFLGRPLGIPVWFGVVRSGGFSAFAEPVAADGRSPAEDGGAAPGCRLTMNDGDRRFDSRDEMLDAAGHEIVHCFQFSIVAPVGPLWVAEGLAAWIEATLSPRPTRVVQGWWNEWLADPKKALFRRDYDAIGFWAAQDQIGRSPWRLFDPVLYAIRDARSAGGDLLEQGRSVYDVATVRDLTSPAKVASRVARVPRLGSDWEAAGPGITRARATRTVRLRAGQSLSDARMVEWYGSVAYELEATGEVLTLEWSAPQSAFGMSGFRTEHLRSDQQRRYCIDPRGCPPCPDGSAPPGPALSTGSGVAAVALANDGVDYRVSIRFRARVQRVRDLCDPSTGNATACELLSAHKVSEVLGRGYSRHEAFNEGPGITANGDHAPGTSCTYIGPRYGTTGPIERGGQAVNDAVGISITRLNAQGSFEAHVNAYWPAFSRTAYAELARLGDRAAYAASSNTFVGDHAHLAFTFRDAFVTIGLGVWHCYYGSAELGNERCEELNRRLDPREGLIRLARTVIDELDAAGRA